MLGVRLDGDFVQSSSMPCLESTICTSIMIADGMARTDISGVRNLECNKATLLENFSWH